jgi:PAS domain S-box-containing protein
VVPIRLGRDFEVSILLAAACFEIGMSGLAPAGITASQWRQIVNGATETAIISTDRHGNITSWNAGAVAILGWTEMDVLGHSINRIFVEEDRVALLAREIEDAIAFGHGGGEEGWRLRKDGSRFWAVGELSPIWKGRKVVGFIKILRDRTAQRQAEDETRDERRALEVLNRAGSALALETTSINWFRL